MSEATCKTCPTWYKEDAWEKGQCRSHSPHVWPEGAYGGYDPESAWWPLTAEDDWCGEHPDRKAAS